MCNNITSPSHRFEESWYVPCIHLAPSSKLREIEQVNIVNCGLYSSFLLKAFSGTLPLLIRWHAEMVRRRVPSTLLWPLSVMPGCGLTHPQRQWMRRVDCTECMTVMVSMGLSTTHVTHTIAWRLWLRGSKNIVAGPCRLLLLAGR